MKIPKLIVMLTHHDVTAPDSKEIFLAAKDAPADCWGFKNVGLPEEQMKELCALMKEAGKTTFLESLAYTEQETLDSLSLAARCGFDYMLGAHYFPSAQAFAKKEHIRFLPFVGKRKDHKLYGEIEEIVDEERRVLESGAYGVNLSGFRYVGDAPRLIEAVVKAAGEKPVSIVGSIDTYERLEMIRRIAPTMFTIGGAFFERKFGGSFSEQIEAVSRYLESGG